MISEVETKGGRYLKLINELKMILGIPPNTTTAAEKLLSALGAAVSIFAVAFFTARFALVQDTAYVMIVASMGASAVLLFAVPHGALSQPWALFGGHLISGVIGVTCFQVFGNSDMSAAVAVGLAVGVMYFLRCIHPPGGATALTAVIGGAGVTDLHYQFIFNPLLVNVVVILAIAIIFNGAFFWRRYPAHFYFQQSHYTSTPIAREFELSQEDLSAALQQHNSFTDITEEGLNDLLELAKQHANETSIHPQQIVSERFYSNGRLGKFWSIRQVSSINSVKNYFLPSDRVRFQVVAGENKGTSQESSLAEFIQWARFEVIQSDGRWVKPL